LLVRGMRLAQAIGRDCLIFGLLLLLGVSDYWDSLIFINAHITKLQFKFKEHNYEISINLIMLSQVLYQLMTCLQSVHKNGE
jgi:hypothetical protein